MRCLTLLRLAHCFLKRLGSFIGENVQVERCLAPLLWQVLRFLNEKAVASLNEIQSVGHTISNFGLRTHINKIWQAVEIEAAC